MTNMATGLSTPETVPPVLEEVEACAAPMDREEDPAEAPNEVAAEVPKEVSFPEVAKEPEEAAFLAGLNIIVLPSRTKGAIDNKWRPLVHRFFKKDLLDISNVEIIHTFMLPF